jgi:hypothetical protein
VDHQVAQPRRTTGRGAGVSMESTRLRMQRDSAIAAHLKLQPPWWRLFARRRWRQRLAAFRAMDVSMQTEMLRELYPSSEMERLARQANPFLSLVPAAPPSGRRFVESVVISAADWDITP